MKRALVKYVNNKGSGILCIHAVAPKPSLFAHRIQETSGCFRQRFLANLRRRLICELIDRPPSSVCIRVDKNPGFMSIVQRNGFYWKNLGFSRVILGFTG